MEKKWTKAQSLAIEQKGKTLLVSAAAGSGKTATLTERIVRSVTSKENPADISRILIVTFTRLAATELKQRLSAALSREIAKNPTNKHLSRQIVMLEGAKISTIDSFYFDVVRSNFNKIGLPSSFRIGDEGELTLLRKGIMEELLDELYDKDADSKTSFPRFVENFVEIRNSDALSDLFLNLYKKLSSRTEGVEAIRIFAEEYKNSSKEDYFLSRQGKLTLDYLKGAFKHYINAFSKCCDDIILDEKMSKAYFASYSYDKKFCESVYDALNEENFSKTRDKILSYAPIKLSALRGYDDENTECIKAVRKEFSAFIKDISSKIFSYSAEEISTLVLQSADVLEELYKILAEFSSRLLEEKYRRKVFEFNDIRNFALQILSDGHGNPSETAREYSEKFDEIYIDEYQDVDPVQDLIFRLIAKPDNRFMVGDIKQSIYSFRGADSEIFAGYKKAFPSLEGAENSDCASIFMSNNFRCDENIIDFTNRIFSFVFGHCGESIEYTTDDNLIFSKVEEGRTMPSPKVNLTIIAKDEEKAEEERTHNPEAIYIAKEISRLLKEEKKADGTPIEPRDIAVIARSTTISADIAEALALYNIPCADNSKKDFFETPDVLLVLSLLSAIDNPHKDIPLAATLYSPFFAYTMDDLIEIREGADSSHSLYEALKAYSENEFAKQEILAKNEYFLSKLKLFREFASASPIDKLLKFIYKDLSIMSFAYDGQTNLLKLYELSRKFESVSFKGLNNFVSYINELIAENKIPESAEDDSVSNSVKLISAHKSKGLEFPVCFVCSTHSPYNKDDRKGNLLYSAHAGIAMRLAHKSGLAKLNTPMREALILSIDKAQSEEEMRILYVALTRARERLYITAKPQSKYEKIIQNAYKNNLFADKFSIAECSSWLELILASCAVGFEGKDFNLNVYHRSEMIFDGDLIEKPEKKEELKEDKKITAELKERFDFIYPYEHLSKIPAKLSVSKLTPTILDDPDDDSVSLSLPDISEICDIGEFLSGREKTTGAEIGTATHLFMQFCNFVNCEKNGVENELARLVESKFIPESTAKLINLSWAEGFFKSDLYSLLKNAKKVYREQRFNILLPASHFTEDYKDELEGEKVLVQGVMDLFFIASNGELILCDYKTDYLTPAELNNPELAKEKLAKRHTEQLSYYAMALKEMFGKTPKKIYIYSLPLGKAIEM